MIVKDGTPSERMFVLAKAINDLPGNSLVILSSDFSHYLEKNISDFHDRESISVINNFDFSEIDKLETDCLPELFFLLKFAELSKYQKFNMLDNSNSSKVYGQYFVGENTSYVTGYFSKGRKNAKLKNINLLFLGDIMLDRQIRQLMEKQGVEFLTKKFERLFRGQDLNIANLEGAITNKLSVSVGAKKIIRIIFYSLFLRSKPDIFYCTIELV